MQTVSLAGDTDSFAHLKLKHSQYCVLPFIIYYIKSFELLYHKHVWKVLYHLYNYQIK